MMKSPYLMIKPCRTLVYRILAGISCWTMLDPTSHSLAIPLWGTTTRPYHRLWDRRVALWSGVFWQVCMSHLSISLSVYQSIYLPIYLSIYIMLCHIVLFCFTLYIHIYIHIYMHTYIVYIVRIQVYIYPL